jgi:hypothetical protein
MATGLTRPQDKVVVDPKTGRLTLEWDTFFNNIGKILGGTLSQFTGRILAVQSFTTTGTYTPTTGALSALVVCVGAGGGGGGTGIIATGAVGGGGGGSGGYSQHFISGTLATQTVTIGAGGTAGPGAFDAGGNGGNGAATSFGALCIANGGSGGPGASATAYTIVNGGAGATAGTGNIAVAPGADGGMNNIVWVSPFTSIGGIGAASKMSGSTNTPPIILNGNTNGVAGKVYGGGGSGAAAIQGTFSTSGTGGVGAKGICIVYEYT